MLCLSILSGFIQQSVTGQERLRVIVYTGSSIEAEVPQFVKSLHDKDVTPAVIFSPDSILCLVSAPLLENPNFLPKGMSMGPVISTDLYSTVQLRSRLSGGTLTLSRDGCVVGDVVDQSNNDLSRSGVPTANIVGSSYVSNNERMTGTVVVTLIFPESDGTIDQSIYDWNDDLESDALQSVTFDLAFLSEQAAKHFIPLTFRLLVYNSATPEVTDQGFEPYDTYCRACQPYPWVTAIAQNLGYGTINEYNRAMRTSYASDWAVTGFVINSPIVESAFGYAYTGSGYVVIGQNVFRGLFAHETAHLFGAFDEYDPGGTGCDWSWNGTPNSNSRVSPCLGTTPCVMDRLSAGQFCSYTAAHLGWTSAPPVARAIFPDHGDVVREGFVEFSWEPRTTDATISSVIEILDGRSDSILYRSDPRNQETRFRVQLDAGEYTWRIINGGGYRRGYWTKRWTPDSRIIVVSELPSIDAFLQNYPNPSNPGTVFVFDLKRKAHLTLKIFDGVGREVAIVLDKLVQPGQHSIPYLTSDLDSGTYYSVLRVDGVPFVRKVLIVR